VILDALDRLMAGRTTFIIAHRLSTIRYSDIILVVSEGRIVEQGSHSDLLNARGMYYQLHEMQTHQRKNRRIPLHINVTASEPA
jgi:ABC-type multidrug transport system fused ATPase/permease subunit